MIQDEIQIGSRLRIAPEAVLKREIDKIRPELDSTYLSAMCKRAGMDFTVKEMYRDPWGFFYLSEEGVECQGSLGVRYKIFAWALEPRDDQEELSAPDLDGLFDLFTPDKRKETA